MENITQLECPAEIPADQFNNKLCLIEDVIKAKRLLYGLGINSHIDAVLRPAAVFDALYELSNEALSVTLELYSLRINRLMAFKMHG